MQFLAVDTERRGNQVMTVLHSGNVHIMQSELDNLIRFCIFLPCDFHLFQFYDENIVAAPRDDTTEF